MATMRKHYVTLLSPGTFVHEQTTEEVPAWDVDAAVAFSRGVTERYGAKPFAFYFTTRERGEGDFDSREVAKSPMYFLGGRVRTLAEVEAENDPKEAILRSNMKCNGYDRVITNTNSWKVTVPLRDGDVVLDY